MTDLRQAAQQALEALERAREIAMLQTLKARIPECGEFSAIAQDVDWSIITMKAALEQPEQEPVAYLCENAVGHKYFRWKKPSSTYKPIALYTTPPAAQPKWQGLTDEDWEKVGDMPDTFDQGAAWAAARLKERNNG